MLRPTFHAFSQLGMLGAQNAHTKSWCRMYLTVTVETWLKGVRWWGGGAADQAAMDVSAEDYLKQHQELEEEALKLMPWNPQKCTYESGPLRQQVFACRSHGNVGLCYSCSINCHTSCDIVELFTKRNFMCDCGTDKYDIKDTFKCRLRKNREVDIASQTNVYGQNFEGRFCSCRTEYDPESSAVMIQCILGLECNEDWYHDYCIMGVQSSVERINSEKTSELDKVIKGFPALDSFETFVCWKCVKKFETYFKRLLSHELSDALVAYIVPHPVDNPSSDNALNPSNKRTRTDDDNEYSIFFKEDYSKTLGKIKSSLDKQEDSKLFSFLDTIAPFLINDEPVYEPPEDINASSYELGERSLQTVLDRELAVSGIAAFQSIKSKLNDFLKPFAETGKVVSEEDVKKFFEQAK